MQTMSSTYTISELLNVSSRLGLPVSFHFHYNSTSASNSIQERRSHGSKSSQTSILREVDILSKESMRYRRWVKHNRPSPRSDPCGAIHRPYPLVQELP